MSAEKQARYLALAACGATVVAFVGACHLAVGAALFPWGPATFGGPIGWNLAGILTIVVGLLVLGGTLAVISFPVVTFSLIVAVIGTVGVVFSAIAHREFHFFALSLALSGGLTAICYRLAATGGNRDLGLPPRSL